MHPRSFLRGEGLGFAAVALGGLFVTDAPLWLVVVLALTPDVGMVGYVVSPRVGALTYNVLHWYPIPVAVAATGVWAGLELGVWIGLIWVAHIGLDRTVGYGLKYDDAFSHTHVSATDPTR